MNFKIVRYVLSWILKFESLFLLLPMVVGILYKETNDVIAYLISAALCALFGFVIIRKKPVPFRLYAREGFVSVALGWIVLSMFGALPFVLSGDIPNYINALFETISGFTTTGSSILSDVEALSRANLFWRSFTHWIGGMGVFVFIMAILPMMGGSTMNLMRAESPGPAVGKLVPRARDTAKLLYQLYLAITIIGVIVLCLCGVSVFDSFTTIFGTVGTGGFGIYNDSMARFSPPAQNMVTVFMILSGINYTFYYCLLRKQIKAAFTIDEVIWYLVIIFASTTAIVFNVKDMYGSLAETIRHAAFQVGSIITTTGFSTTDFDTWPQFSKTILVLLMFIGACSGSTGGGIKVSRIVLLARSIGKELSMVIHPRLVRKTKMDGRIVPHEVIRSTNAYMAVYLILFAASVLLVSLDNFDFTTNFTAVAATFNNIGPGLSKVGPMCNFDLYSPFSKIVLMFDMLAGRLELFPMLVLFMPACWKKY